MKDRFRWFEVFRATHQRHKWLQARPSQSRRAWCGPRRQRRDSRRDRRRPRLKVPVAAD